MASGHVNRTNRPNTWLHRLTLQRENFPCQLGAVHTWHKADIAVVSANVRFWVVGSIGRCNTSIKSRSARVSKPKVSRDRSLRCRATRLNWECAPPAVPQLLLGHRVEPSNISSTHRPSTSSLASDITCCVDPLRPPVKSGHCY
jgi:hypothetical protein